MGQQTQIFSTALDDKKFQEFFETNFECDFYQGFSPTKEGVLIRDFSNTLGEHNQITIYNKAFPWIPLYKQTSTKEQWYYVSNKSNAPVIEYSKTDTKNNKHGRIYWSKYFSGNPDYDVKEFEKFYGRVVRWVKKNAKGKVKWSGCNIYYFEDAWEKKSLQKAD
jgi:hypothetical protein